MVGRGRQVSSETLARNTAQEEHSQILERGCINIIMTTIRIDHMSVYNVNANKLRQATETTSRLMIAVVFRTYTADNLGTTDTCYTLLHVNRPITTTIRPIQGVHVVMTTVECAIV